MQVARVVSVEEIDSAKLYKCKVELSNGVMKQVMAGLKQHMAKDELLHTLVVVITNLKAAKLAGQLSEAMILAAQAPVADSPNGELVKVLQPPGQCTCLYTCFYISHSLSVCCYTACALLTLQTAHITLHSSWVSLFNLDVEVCQMPHEHDCRSTFC